MRPRRGGGRVARPGSGDPGTTLAELLIVVGALGLLAGASLPAVTRAVDAARARHAAGVVASELRAARLQAVARTRTVGIAFDRASDGQWSLRRCQDGNANGLRRREIADGVDTCAPPLVLADALPGVALQVDPGLPGPEGSASSADPVRFGSSDLASCSPDGTCTPGTCYVRSQQGVQYAVRLAGATGRLRILRYDSGARRWVTR